MEVSRSLRYAATKSFSASRTVSYSQIFSTVSRKLTYAATRKASASRKLRYECAGPEVAESPLSPADPTYPGFGLTAGDLAWQCGQGDLEIITMTANGRSMPLTGVLEIELNDSGAHRWSWSIEDPTGYYHPEKRGGDWEGVMTDEYDHEFVFVGKWGSEVLRFAGVPENYGHSRSASDRKLVFTWSGICKSFPLFEDDVTLPTLRSTRTNVVNMVQGLTEALQEAGVQWENLPPFPPLRLHHRQSGKLGDWMQRYLNRIGWGWTFKNDKIHFYPLRVGAARYRYDASSVVESENLKSPNSGLYSRVRIRRVVESGDIATNPITAKEFGDGYRVDFPEPMYGVTWRPLVESLGSFSDFISRNPNGEVIAVDEIRGGVWPAFLIGAPKNNVKSVNFTFGANPGVVAAEGSGQIVFTGRTADKEDSEFPKEFETSFVVNVSNSYLASKVGSRGKELPVDEMVGTQAHARAYGEAHLKRMQTYYKPKDLTVMLNFGLYPGETVFERDPILNRTQKGFIRQVRHRIVADPAQRKTTYVASGWEDA